MRNYSDWLAAFVDYASYGEAPPYMYKWVGISTIAGALRRKVRLNMGYFEWTPNFYVIIVAPPGIVSKSTTAGIGMELLREIPGIKFGPDVVTWQMLSQTLAESCEEYVDSEGMFHKMTALTIESSEFGNLFNPHDREMVDFYITLWDGKRGKLQKATKTSGSDVIINPWVNLIACTTPAWIAGNFPEYMIGGGFTSRCVFVYASEKHKYVAYPGLVMPPKILEQKAKLIQDLEQISLLQGDYSIHPDAVEWGEAWYIKHYNNRPIHLNNERFGGYIARKQTHMHKLAMVLSAARRGDLQLTVSDLEEANAELSALEEMMPKVFEQIGKSEDSRIADEVVSIIRGLGEPIYSDAFAVCFRIVPDVDRFNDLIESLKQAGRIALKPAGNTARLVALR